MKHRLRIGVLFYTIILLDLAMGLFAPVSSSVLKRRYISLQNEWMNEWAETDIRLSVKLRAKLVVQYSGGTLMIKVVLQMLDMGMSNAFLLYRKCGGNCHQVWFRSQIIRSLIASQDRPAGVSVALTVFLHHKPSNMSRLSGQHYIDIIPHTEHKTSPATKCVVCNKRWLRKEAHYICGTCLSQPTLFVVPCFQECHSSVHVAEE